MKVIGKLSLLGVVGIVTTKLAEAFRREKVSDADLLSYGGFAARRRTWLKKREINTLKSL
jgi:hypothetical protein